MDESNQALANELEDLAIRHDAYSIIVDKETFLKVWDLVYPVNRISNWQVIYVFTRPDKAKQKIVIELSEDERTHLIHEAKNVIDISKGGLK